MPEPRAPDTRGGGLSSFAFLVLRVASHGAHLASFVLLVWFIESKLDRPTGDLGVARSLLIDACLVGLFALQHSGMARRSFRAPLERRWGPEAVRTIYVLFSSLALGALCGFWQGLPGQIWELEGTARFAMFGASGAGWLLAIVATAQMDPLLGLWGRREVRLNRGGLYRIVRHPAYAGMLIVFWAAETMTWTHLVFAAGFTAYVAVGIHLEERDLLAAFPEYAEYRSRVPTLVPVPKRRHL